MYAAVSIDIGEKKIRIIKTRRMNVIIKAGEFELQDKLQASSGEAYINALSSGIKAAAKAAGIRKTKNCVLTVGGAHIIARHFLWPEMPAEALDLNAETEMALYLPMATEFFNISWRILRKNPPTEKKDGEESRAASIEVLVAAIEKGIAEALTKAAKLAGFNPARIDIRENARHKIFSLPELWISDRKLVTSFGSVVMQPDVFDPEDSFAILDIADTLMNMTVFINGVFYANRYFGDLVTDEDSLAAEAVSIIEYIGYKERGSHIKTLFILGDEQLMPHLKQSMEESLNIDIYYPQKTVALNYFDKKYRSAKLRIYMDALGAIVPLEKGVREIDLKTGKSSENNLARTFRPIAAALLFFAGLAAAGVYMTNHTILRLEAEQKRLSQELVRHTISPADLASITNEINIMTKTLDEIGAFHSQYPSALEVLNGLYGALPKEAEINAVTVNKGNITVSGTTGRLDIVSSYLEALRENRMFSRVSAETALSRAEEEQVRVYFEITITAAEEGGEAANPAES